GRYGDAPRAEPKPDGRRLATHVRRVAFLPERHLIVVVDDLIPVDLAEHHYEARWHLKSTTAVLDPTSGACRTKDEGRPNLAVVPLGADAPEVRVVRGQEEPEL